MELGALNEVGKYIPFLLFITDSFSSLNANALYL